MPDATPEAPTLILILGDQLSENLSSLAGMTPDACVLLMAEVADEAAYVAHHKQKLAFVFSAMRHHAAALRDAGWRVDYVALTDPGNSGSLTGELARATERHRVAAIRMTEAQEWRLRHAMGEYASAAPVPVTILPDDRFLCSEAEFAAWADGRRSLRMEYFYRDMRRRHRLLMDGDEPAKGQWNFDADNRQPPAGVANVPVPLRFAPDAVTRDVLDLVADRFASNFGSLDHFGYAVTAADAAAVLDDFIARRLPRFGDYQDAMLADQPFMFHALIGLYLNIGLLDPLHVCRRAEAAYLAGDAPINAVEGFIRQIIGWREYVRGIYWWAGEAYVERNALAATAPLPSFYWTAQTDMACLRSVITQTRDHAYAHHIQRLMITGNFALLAGIDPREVHEWYLAVYADAYEWVELPNTLGMSQYADDGLLASKPYAASGAYISRMSDYCGGCRYKVQVKAGADACPFNYLYWDFIARHADRFAGNGRMRNIVGGWRRFSAERQAEIRADAARFLATLKP